MNELLLCVTLFLFWPLLGYILGADFKEELFITVFSLGWTWMIYGHELMGLIVAVIGVAGLIIVENLNLRKTKSTPRNS